MIALDLHPISLVIIYLISIIIEFIILHQNKKKYFMVVVFTLYILLLFKIVICPIIYLKPENREEFLDNFEKLLQYYQLIPFKSIIGSFENGVWFKQTIGNIFLLFPLPIFINLLSKKKLKGIKIFLICFFVSLLIECMQLLINIIGIMPSHVADIDDLILNSIGIFLGTILMIYIKKKNLKEVLLR